MSRQKLHVRLLWRLAYLGFNMHSSHDLLLSHKPFYQL